VSSGMSWERPMVMVAMDPLCWHVGCSVQLSEFEIGACFIIVFYQGCGCIPEHVIGDEFVKFVIGAVCGVLLGRWGRCSNLVGVLG
jgi:hypothetical protein